MVAWLRNHSVFCTHSVRLRKKVKSIFHADLFSVSAILMEHQNIRGYSTRLTKPTADPRPPTNNHAPWWSRSELLLLWRKFSSNKTSTNTNDVLRSSVGRLRQVEETGIVQFPVAEAIGHKDLVLSWDCMCCPHCIVQNQIVALAVRLLHFERDNFSVGLECGVDQQRYSCVGGTELRIRAILSPHAQHRVLSWGCAC